MAAQTDSDPAIAFSTHANYVDAFSQLAGYTSTSRWDAALAALPPQVDAFLGATPRPTMPWTGDLAQVERSLRSAWGTELLLLQQLALVEEVQDLARVIASWAVIQTYYTGYHATQALLVADRRPRPPGHPKTQTGYVNSWAGRAGVLAPWTMTFSCDGHAGAPTPIDDTVSNLSTPGPGNRTSLAAKALRTTWEQARGESRAKEAVAKLRRDRKAFNDAQAQLQAAGRKLKATPPWYGQQRRNLTADEKAKVDRGVGPYGLLHYLYRLRIKANYVDAETFTDGPTTDWDGMRFVRDLSFIAAAIVVVHEQRVRHLIGMEAVQVIRDRWCAGPGRVLPDRGPSAAYRHMP